MAYKFNISNRSVIITGGSGFLGIKHAEVVAEFGGIPILLDINIKQGQKKLEKINKEFKTEGEIFHCNITDEKQVIEIKNKIINRFGKIDVLINNATIDPKVGKGEYNLSRLENFSKKQWNLEIDVGLTGAMICSKIFGSEMAKDGRGVILNIASDLSILFTEK